MLTFSKTHRLHSTHSINCDKGPFVDNKEGGVEIDGCLDPLNLENAIPLELVDDHPEIGTSDPTDAPDPGSHADPEVDSCPPLPKLSQDNYLFSEGPDIKELLDNVKLEDLQLQLQFIQEINNASLEDEGTQMDKDDLHRLQNPFDCELALDDASDLRLSLKLLFVNINSPVEVYNANHAAMLWRHPNNDIFTYDRAKCFVKDLTGVVPLIHDMCIDTCVVYTGPYHCLAECPPCKVLQYDPVVFEVSRGKKKVAQWQFHTLPVGSQLGVLYCSKESAE